MGKYILGIGLLAITFTILFIYIKIKRFAKNTFGTDDFKKIAASQEELLANTPKSVSGMTSLYLPQLQKDFPELNWIEFQNLAEKHLKEFAATLSVTGFKIHQTVLRDYKKKAGTCYVVFQSAAEYRKEQKKIQSRFETTLAYVQDAEKTGHVSSYSINCPNCGAPVSSLGSKHCEYCGSEVVGVSMHIWTLNGVREIG